MAYLITSGHVGFQPIADTSTTKNHPVGTRVRAYDETYGEGEFIYLKGIGSTTVGSLVTWNATDGTTTLAAVGANKSFPIGVAMSANVADQYGWYQIAGQAVMKKTCTISLAAGAAVGVLTTGLVAGTGSGKEIQSAIVMAVASATAGRTTVRVLIERPHIQGRVS